MARILAISSQVARGHVGLSAIVPTLQRLGHEVTALPTILLSNHPGHAKVAGQQVAPDLLRRVLDALEANGWLSETDAVITGYLPSISHVEVAIDAIGRVTSNRSDARILVDPVLGDEPKGVYIDRSAAERIRDELVPLADTVTPNAFELGWLTSIAITSIAGALGACEALTPRYVLATSVPGDRQTELENLLFERGTGKALACTVTRQDRVPNGTGDFLSALYLGHGLRGMAAGDALAVSIGGVDAAIKASVGHDELQLASSQAAWADAGPWPVRLARTEC